MVIRVSVVVPTLNRERDLSECLGALMAQDFEGFEIIVVDGGSADGTRELVTSLGRRVRFLTKKAPGAAAARNKGIASSKGKFIAFTDDDCVPSPSWLSQLMASFPEDRKCAAVGGEVVSHRGGLIPEFAESRGMGRPVAFGDRALHLPTTNALYRKEALAAAGSFDRRLIFAEDTNLSMKVLRRGFWLGLARGAAVRHKDPQSVGMLYRKGWNYGYGIALISAIEGRPLDLGKIRPFRSRSQTEPGLTLVKRAAFLALEKIHSMGIRSGFRAGSQSHISSR